MCAFNYRFVPATEVSAALRAADRRLEPFDPHAAEAA